MKRLLKLLCILLCTVTVCGCSYFTYIPGGGQNVGLAPAEGTLQVWIMDVGQADCIYISFPNGENALIDAGNNADGELIVDYLYKNGVQRINYLFGTHPHEDHIGGLDNVIKELEIDHIYLPRVADKYVPTTKTYENVLDAIAQKAYKVHAATAGTKVIDTEGLRLQIFSPDSTAYKDMNLYSIVLRLDFGEHSFLLTGDAETDNEEVILHAGYDVDVDVLKIGHHGSNTSSGKAFLQAVSPQYAVISCGAGNNYGHPTQNTLNKLESTGAKLYRTDVDGTVVFTANEQGLTAECRPDIILDGNGER